MGAYCDLVGQRFGRLVVVKDSLKRSTNGSVIWLCKCDCGNEINVNSRTLLLGESQSCGSCPNTNYYIVGVIDEKRKKTHTSFLIDIDDVALVQQHKWHMSRGYVVTKINGKGVPLHHIIMDMPNSNIDHINQNPLDNRKCNLRLCNQHQNTANTGLFKHNTSGYKGVCWDSGRKKYMAKIKVYGRTKFLGRYDTPEQAALAYNESAKIVFGEFARLNNVGDTTGYNTINNKEI